MIRWASAQSLSTRGFRLFSNSLSPLESPHLPRVKLENGRFISPWPNSSGMNGTYVYNSLFKREKSYKLSSPKYAFNHEAIRLHKHLDLINEFLHLRTMKFMWLGHSTCYVQMGGAFILTDPVWCQRVSPFRSLGPARLMQVPLEIEELPRVDIVLLSHTHYDHLDLASVYRIGNKALWIVPLGVKSYLAGHGIHNCIELNWWESYSFTSRESVKMSVTFTPTQHWTARTLFDKNTCLWGSFAVKSADGQSFFFGGDTAFNAACFGSIGEALGPFDLAALPIGAYKPRKLTRHVHCDPEEAIRIHKLLKAKQSVGIHWGTYPLTAEDAVEPPLELHRARMEADVSSSQFFTTVPGQVYALGEEPEDDFALQNMDLYNLYIEQVWSKERNDLELLSSS